MIRTRRDQGLFLFLGIDPEPGEAYGHGQTVEGLNRNAPLGPFYLAAVTRERGLHCDVIDQRIEPFTAAQLAAAVRAEQPPWLAFYLCDYDILQRKAVQMIRAVKAVADVPVICGGPPYDPRPVLEAGAQAVATGEGERTFLQWLEHLEGKRALADVKGIVYLADGMLRDTGPAELVENLDELPFPIRKYHGKYIITGNPMMRMPVYELISNRGCPMHCGFCSSHRFWRNLRTRSVDNVIDETIMLRRDYGARYLHFRDDIFAPSRKWLNEWADKHVTRGSNLPYSIYLHPDSYKGDVEGGIATLARSGCNMICYGLQSVNAHLLANIDRDGGEPARLAEHLATCKRHDVMSFVSVIVGLPGETGREADETGRWLRRHRPTIMLALPLQKLYNSPIAEGFPGDTPVSELSDLQIADSITRITRRFYLTGWHLPRMVWFILRKNPRWFLFAIRRLKHGLDFFQFTRRRKNW